MSEIITAVVSFVAFLLHSITGFGGNIMVFPVLSFLYGTSTARVCLNLIAWVSSISVTIDSHKDINFSEYRKILVWMALGLVSGYLLIPYIKSERTLMLIYGGIIILVALQKLIFVNGLTFNKSCLTLILVLAGIIQAIFVSGGAFLVIYCAQVLRDKREFRATFTAIWFTVYTVTFFVQLFGSGYDSNEIQIALFGAVPVVIASIIGSHITKKLNQQLFMKIVYVFILIVGVSLVTSNLVA